MLTTLEFTQLSNLIEEAEKNTSGEIRIVIQKRKHWLERKRSIFELSVKEFHRLKMDRTEHHAGVLIFVLEKDRMFQILADVGIAKKIPQEEWNQMAQKMSEHFKNKNYIDGLTQVIRDVGNKLAVDFPASAQKRNELSNDVVLR